MIVIVYYKDVDDVSDYEWELVKKGWNKVNVFLSIVYYNLYNLNWNDL